MGSFPLPIFFLFRSRKLYLIYGVTLNLHKVELWVLFVCITHWNCWYALLYATKELPVLVEGPGHPLEHWDMLRLHPFPLDSAKPPAAFTCIRAGPFEDASFCGLVFGVPGASMYLYISPKGHAPRLSLYPGFLIPLAILTSRERWGHFKPPAGVCK